MKNVLDFYLLKSDFLSRKKKYESVEINVISTAYNN